MSTLLATYYGHTIFSLYNGNHDVYSRILAKFKQTKDDEVTQLKYNENSFNTRALYRILNMPTTDIDMTSASTLYNCHVCVCAKSIEKNRSIWCSKCSRKRDSNCKCKGFLPITVKSVHFVDSRIRDTLIQLSLLCSETDITSFVKVLGDFNQLFVRSSPALNDLFARAFSPCNELRRIDTLELRQDKMQKIAQHSTSLISRDELNDSIKSILWEETREFQVVVNLLRIQWLFKSPPGQE